MNLKIVVNMAVCTLRHFESRAQISLVCIFQTFVLFTVDIQNTHIWIGSSKEICLIFKKLAILNSRNENIVQTNCSETTYV